MNTLFALLLLAGLTALPKTDRIPVEPPSVPKTKMLPPGRTVIRGTLPPGATIIRKLPGALTPDKRYFEAAPPRLQPALIPAALKLLPVRTGELRAILCRERPPFRSPDMPVWGGLVIGLQEIGKSPVEPGSPLEMLALMYVSRFEQAEKLGLRILVNHPDDYAATVLLGLLAVYDRQNWQYFEKAFSTAPTETLHIFLWHLEHLAIPHRTVWDFADAFFRLMECHADRIELKKLPVNAGIRLNKAFAAKYGSEAVAFPKLRKVFSSLPDPDRILDVAPNPRLAVSMQRRFVNCGKMLSSDRNFFAFHSNAAVSDPTLVRQNMPRMQQCMEELLVRRKLQPAAGDFIQWGKIVAEAPDPSVFGVDKHSSLYMLALMYAQRFDEAEKLGYELAAAHPGDYAATVLLGFLAVYHKRNFQYLERAFIIAPRYTLQFFEWQLHQLNITPKEQWDFVDAFYIMLGRHLNQWQNHDVRSSVLRDGFFAKYGNYYDPEVCGKLPEELQKVAAKLRQIRIITQ